MSSPLSEDDGWSPSARELLHAYRSDHDPSSFERARLQRALAERLARPGSLTASLPQTRNAGQGFVWVASTKRWFVGACLAVAVAGAFRTIQPHPRGPKPAPLTAALTERTEVPHALSTPAATPATQAAQTQPANAKPAIVPTKARVHTTSLAPSMSPARRLRSAKNTRAVAIPPRDAAAKCVADGSSVQGGGVVSNALPPSAAPERPDQSAAPAVEAHATALPSDGEIAPPNGIAEAQLERAFMARIQIAVRGVKLRQALALCAEHERRWPHGMFQQEREGVRALAACKLQLAEAQSRAHAFLADYPHGALAPSVRAACDSVAAAPQHLAHAH